MGQSVERERVRFAESSQTDTTKTYDRTNKKHTIPEALLLS